MSAPLPCFSEGCDACIAAFFRLCSLLVAAPRVPGFARRLRVSTAATYNPRSDNL